MKIKSIFFDFDGVLAESVHVKTEAFRQMYLPYGKEVADKVVAHHRANGGVSRYEKFRIWNKAFLNEEIDEQRVQELAQQFSNLVVDGVVASTEINGATYFLEKYYQKLQFWIITGTPTIEIEPIVKARNMGKYFIELCGSPTKKPTWTEYLVEKHQLNREEVIFLGDAMSDYKASQHSKLHFALRDYDENKELFKDYKLRRFVDFYDLEKQLIQSELL